MFSFIPDGNRGYRLVSQFQESEIDTGFLIEEIAESTYRLIDQIQTECFSDYGIDVFRMISESTPGRFESMSIGHFITGPLPQQLELIKIVLPFVDHK